VAANLGYRKTSFTFFPHGTGMRRLIILLSPLLLVGCGWSSNLVATTAIAANAGSIAAIHRTPFDAIYSAVTGRDCSVVRLDRGESYCRPTEPPPAPPEYCTHSLGVVNCWTQPPSPEPGVADGRWALTASQEENRTRTWP
jgi:hypothetical protein